MNPIMFTFHTCAETHDGQHSYIFVASSTILCLLLQCLWLGHSLRQACFRHKAHITFTDMDRTSKQLHVLFFTQLFVAMYWTLCDLLRLVIDPYFTIRNHIGCGIMTYSPRPCYSIFGFLYLYQILLRLKRSFTGSYLALSKWLEYVLWTLIVITLIVTVITFRPDAAALNTICIEEWTPSDIGGTLTYCKQELNDYIYVMAPLSIAMMVLTTLSMACIFSCTLKRMMSNNKDNEALNVPFKKLIVKNHLMTVTGCVAIVVTHVLSFYTDLGLWANMMTLIVSISIGLMFGYNDKPYRKLCKPCIRFTNQRLKIQEHIREKLSSTIVSWKASMGSLGSMQSVDVVESPIPPNTPADGVENTVMRFPSMHDLSGNVSLDIESMDCQQSQHSQECNDNEVPP